jgi:hypothetical protein
VLLAGLEREAVGGVALAVDGGADETPRQAALERVAAREVGRVRPAVAHRHAEALRRAERDIGAQLARRRKQREGEEIGGHRDVDTISPLVAGYWRSTPKQSVASASSGRPMTTPMPAACARTCTTAIVCGWQSSAT